jgi:type IV pilus assembly protein PilB
MIKRVTHKKLGELLVERKVITTNQLEKALIIQQGKGGMLGEIFVELGFCDEEAIVQVLTAQYGFPFLPLSNYEVDTEILKMIPENVARQFVLIPIDRVGETLTVAMSNPLNQQAIEDLEMVTGCSILVFVSTTTEIRKAIDHYYKKDSVKKGADSNGP